MKEQDLGNMVDAVNYPSLAPSILPESSKKCEVGHYRDGRRLTNSRRFFFNFFLQFVQLFAINIRINRFIAFFLIFKI